MLVLSRKNKNICPDLQADMEPPFLRSILEMRPQYRRKVYADVIDSLREVAKGISNLNVLIQVTSAIHESPHEGFCTIFHCLPFGLMRICRDSSYTTALLCKTRALEINSSELQDGCQLDLRLGPMLGNHLLHECCTILEDI